MNKTSPRPLPPSIDATVGLLAEADYLADRSLGTVLYLALKMGRPIFLEGEAGVGKTEIAKVVAETLGRRLIRLQCYEGLDVASATPSFCNRSIHSSPDRFAKTLSSIGSSSARFRMRSALVA